MQTLLYSPFCLFVAAKIKEIKLLPFENVLGLVDIGLHCHYFFIGKYFFLTLDSNVKPLITLFHPFIACARPQRLLDSMILWPFRPYVED